MGLILSTKNYLEYVSSTSHTQTLDGLPFVYTADGDTNGLFYYLGTNEGTSPWTNPVTAGKMSIVVKTLAAGTTASLVDREPNQFYTDNTPSRYIGIDIGEGKGMIVSDYLLRNRVESIEYLRTWNLEGSNNVAGSTTADYDAATWETIDSRMNDTLLTAANAYGHYVSEGAAKNKRFRFFRLIQTGLNGAGRDYLCIAEIELYGLFKKS